MLDFRSDTVTRPGPGMLDAMLKAEVGDCGYGEDTATNALEAFCAELLGMDDAVFLSSGTLSNQVALRLHTRPGDEVILDQSYHLNTYESGFCAQFAQVALNTIESGDGIVTADRIDEALDKKRRLWWCAPPTLLGLENTVNHHAGKALTPGQIARPAAYAHSKGMRVHLDGARLFNACAAKGVRATAFTAEVDTVSLCFSKGLGAPYGSVLAGRADVMGEARLHRKLFGAEVRQPGFMAAAALYGLRHNAGRLGVDHRLARYLAAGLTALGLRLTTARPDTNIIVVDTRELPVGAPALAERFLRHGLLVSVLTERFLRFVTHLDVSRPDADTALCIVADVLRALRKEPAAGRKGALTH